MSKKTKFLFIPLLSLLIFSLIASCYPLFQYQFDSCEDLGHWTFSSTFKPVTIDHADYMEGSGSLLVANQSKDYSGTAYASLNSNFVYNTSSMFVGFWMQGLTWTNGDANGGCRIVVYKDATHYWGFSTSQGLGANPKWGMYYVWQDGGAPQSGGIAALSNNVWYWIEIEIQPNSLPNEHAIWVNGTRLITKTGTDLNNTNFRIVGAYGYALGLFNIDYIRISDMEQYPPSDPTYNLAISALNVANGSSISVPMKINDVEYYTPISASLPLGIYIVQPEGLGFNSTHYWKFINWTDGADQVRTINFTGSASYTAYYKLTKIPDVGGYFNFFLGLFGLILIGGSWFVLKWQYDEKNIAVAISAWLAMMMIGFGLCMIMFGA